MRQSKKHKAGVIIIEGHVQGLSNARALGEAGIPVVVIDKNNCLARYSKYCQKFFYCPDFISDEFAPFLVELSQKENLRDWVLMPSNDHAVYSISRNKEELGLYYRIIAPDIETLEKIYDKSKLLTLAKEIGVPIPETQYFTSIAETIDKKLEFPLITKGRFGLTFYKSLGKKVFLSESEVEFREHLKQINDKYHVEETFTQELIPFDGRNKTISFTAFSIAGQIKTFWIGEKVREHPIQFGTATFARSIDMPDLVEPSQKLLKALNYTGVCEIEYLLDPRNGQYKLIEINARTWLWVGLAKSCGINYALYVYNYLNKIETQHPSDYLKGIGWVNYITDTPFSLMAIIKHKLTLKQYFSAFRGKRVDAFFSWSDIKPSLMFFVLLFYIAVKRR